MLAVVTGGLLLTVLVWFNYSAVLPAVVEDWGLTGTEAGVIFGAFQAGYLVAIVPMGALADRYAPNRVIGAGAVGTGLASLAFGALATGFLSGTLLRFLGGAAMAGVYVPGLRFVSDWYPPESRGRAMGAYVGAFSLSSGLSFLFGTGIAEAAGWRLAIGLTSLGALVAGPLVYGLARDSPRATSADSLSVSLDRRLLGNRSYLAAVGIYSWHSWEILGVRNWLLAFLVTVPAIQAADSAVLAGAVVGLTMAVGGLGNLAGGWLSDRLGRARTIALALALSGTISLSLGLLGGLPLRALVPLLLVYGMVLTADSAPTSTLITEVVAEERVATALSLQSFVGFSATVVSPVAFGLALDHSGFVVAFWTLGFGAFVGLALTLFVLPDAADRPHETGHAH
jgi:MFS family permease